MIILQDIVNSLITSEILIAILVGLFIFIISQYTLEIIIRPFVRYKQIKYKILNNLKFYSRIITNPLQKTNIILLDSLKTEEENKRVQKDYQDKINDYIKISDDIRRLSCELDESYYLNLKIIRRIFMKDNVEKASSGLIAISNSLFEHPSSGFDTILHNNDKLDEIKDSLNINFSKLTTKTSKKR